MPVQNRVFFQKIFWLRNFTPLLLGAVFLFSGCAANKQARLENERRQAFDLLTEGQQLKDQGDYLLARDSFLKSAELSERPVVFYEIGSCYEHLGQWEQAAVYYEKSLDLQEDYPAAQAALQFIRQKHPVQQQSAQTIAQTGEKPDEEKNQKKKNTNKKEDPQTDGLFDGVAERFGGVGQKEEESDGDSKPATPQEVRTALFPELDVDQSVTVDQLVTRAKDAERFGRFDEAIRLWERVLEREPKNTSVRISLAKALDRTGRVHRAAQEFERAITDAPNDPETHFAAGNFYAGKSDFQKAALKYARVLELNPDHFRAINNLSVIHLRLGNNELAEEKLEALTTTHPDFSQGWLNLALAREKAGRSEEEILKALETYQRLEPESDEATARWLRELLQ